MIEYERDFYAAGDTSHYNMVTWADLRHAWWAHSPGGVRPEVLPLTPAKIAGVGCLLKSSNYRSGYDYIAAAKDRHLGAGHPWSEILDHAYRRFTMSVQRPNSRSPFLSGSYWR